MFIRYGSPPVIARADDSPDVDGAWFVAVGGEVFEVVFELAVTAMVLAAVAGVVVDGSCLWISGGCVCWSLEDVVSHVGGDGISSMVVWLFCSRVIAFLASACLFLARLCLRLSRCLLCGGPSSSCDSCECSPSMSSFSSLVSLLYRLNWLSSLSI